MKKTFMLLIMMMANTALAETPDGTKYKDVTIQVPEDVTIKVPGAGEDQVVEVPYVIQRIHEVAPSTTYVRKGSNLHLRGGLSTGFGFSGRTDPSYTGGLTGQIGYADSTWRLEATFRAGSCKKGWGDVALDSGLALMGNISKNFRAGIGADLLYCSDVSDDLPKEKADERVVGGSFRLALEQGHISVAGSIGVGAATIPIPGDRETKAVLFGGLSVSVLWGK